MSPDHAFTIFIVDDDAGVARGLSRLLKARGYEIQSFTSSREFLERHDATQPGCAVLDLSMPDLDGLELQQALTREGVVPRPVIFLSGHGDRIGDGRGHNVAAEQRVLRPERSKRFRAALRRVR